MEKTVKQCLPAEPKGSQNVGGQAVKKYWSLLASLLGGITLSVLVLLAFSAPIAAQEGTVTWSASSNPVNWPLTATIIIRAEAFSATSGMCRAPSCETIVLDRSGSMSGSWYTATQAVVEYTGIISQSARAAYIVFNDAASVLLPMGAPDPSAVAQALTGVSPSGWTNIAEAIQLSRSELATCGGIDQRRMVLVGDGEPTHPSDPYTAARQQAILSHGEGNQHYTILVGEDPSQNNLNLFGDIALGTDGSWNGTFVHFTDWNSFYISSTQAVEEPCSEVLPGYYGWISVNAPAGVTVTGSFSWTTLAGGQIITGMLEVVGAQPGNYSVDIEYEWYSPKLAHWVTGSLPVQVEFRTEEPTPTPTTPVPPTSTPEPPYPVAIEGTSKQFYRGQLENLVNLPVTATFSDGGQITLSSPEKWYEMEWGEFSPPVSGETAVIYWDSPNSTGQVVTYTIPFTWQGVGSKHFLMVRPGGRATHLRAEIPSEVQIHTVFTWTAAIEDDWGNPPFFTPWDMECGEEIVELGGSIVGFRPYRNIWPIPESRAVFTATTVAVGYQEPMLFIFGRCSITVEGYSNGFRVVSGLALPNKLYLPMLVRNH